MGDSWRDAFGPPTRLVAKILLVEAFQVALGEARAALDPDVRHVLPSRGIDEMRYGIKAWESLKRRKFHRGEVRALADGDRADVLVEPKRPRALQRRHLEGLGGVHRARIAARRF